MSADTILTEQHIKEQNINCYEYSEFDNIEVIGNSKVCSANWKPDKKFVALKSFSLDNTTVREIICEVCNEICFFLVLKFTRVRKYCGHTTCNMLHMKSKMIFQTHFHI